MEQEPRPYQYKLSLRLNHPNARLDSCAERFGLETIRVWSVGESRTSPRGASLPGVYGDSYWVGALDLIEGEEIEDALARDAEELVRHAAFLGLHRESGGSAEIFVGFFLEGFNSGFPISSSLMSSLGALGVALDFDIYGPSDSPHAP